MCCLFFVQNDSPAKWRWCQICQHCRKLLWSSYIETAAEMLPKDGSSKVAWPFRPCNVCLFFTWRRATMKIETFLMVYCCLQVILSAHLRFRHEHFFPNNDIYDSTDMYTESMNITLHYSINDRLYSCDLRYNNPFRPKNYATVARLLFHMNFCVRC